MPTATLDAETYEWTDPGILVASGAIGGQPLVSVTAQLYSVGGHTLLSDLTLSDEASPRDGIVVAPYSERLNEVPQLTFKIAANHPDLGLIRPFRAELWLFRNDVPESAWVVTARSASTRSGEVTVGCIGLIGWLKKRTHHVAGSDPINWFRNHNFAADLANWAGPIDSFDSGDVDTSTQSAVLTDVGHQLRQVRTLDSWDFDYEVLIRARVKLTDDVPAYTALTVRCPNTAPGNGAVRATTARNVWTWIECTIPVYGTWDRSNQFTTALTGPAAGTMKVDRMIFTLVNASEVLAEQFDVDLEDPPAPPQDAAHIAALAVQAIPDLNLGCRAENTGIMINTPAPGPQMIWDTLNNAAGLGALEFEMELVAPDVRVVHLAHRIGATVSAVAIDAGTMPEFSADEDGMELANVVHAADSEGNYGTAADLTAFDGVKLERIVPVPQGVTDQAGRDAFAGWSLREDAPDVTGHAGRGLPGEWIDLVRIGDTIDTSCQWAFIDLDEAPMRLVGRTVDVHAGFEWDPELTEVDA